MRGINQQTVVYHRLYLSNEINSIRRVPAITQIISCLIFKYQDIRSLNGSVQFFFKEQNINFSKVIRKAWGKCYIIPWYLVPLFGEHKRMIIPCPLEIRHDNVTCFGQWRVRGGEECNFSVEVFNCQPWSSLLLFSGHIEGYIDGKVEFRAITWKITSGESFRTAENFAWGKIKPLCKGHWYLGMFVIAA